MGKSVENPKRYIVSCRVSDHELQVLQEMADRSGLSISNLLRQVLRLDDNRIPASQARA